MKNLWVFFFPENKRAGRICSKCKERIKARHKWQLVNGRCRHKDCKNPELKAIVTPIEQLPLFKAEAQL